MSLTPRQSLFVNEYLVNMNATNAAVRAGYSRKTAKSQASRLLTIVNVKTEISRKQKESEQKLDIDRETVLEGLASAIDIARKEKDGLTMIRAAAEINKMMGYYK
jgi:phage terminase small subunit